MSTAASFPPFVYCYYIDLNFFSEWNRDPKLLWCNSYMQLVIYLLIFSVCTEMYVFSVCKDKLYI